MVDSHGKTGLGILEAQVVSLLGARNLASMRGKGKLNMFGRSMTIYFNWDVRKHKPLRCLPCPKSTLLACHIYWVLPIIKGVQDNIFVCEPLFPYHFLLIATMTKTTFINSQQFLCLILSMCEVITIHKINMNSFVLSTFSWFIAT